MKGRKPLPTNLKVVRGTAKPHRLDNQEPKPEKLSNPEPPATLSADARKHWQTVTGILEHSGVLTAMDQDALAMYCELYSQWVEANRMIQSKGMVLADPRYVGKTTPDGQRMTVPMVSPYFKTSMKLAEQMKHLLCEFGMTPSSRTKIHASSDKPDDDYEAWQKKRRMAREGV